MIRFAERCAEDMTGTAIRHNTTGKYHDLSGGISDNGYMSLYWYDADGSRTVKRHNGGEMLYVNSRLLSQQADTAAYSLYPNGWFGIDNFSRFSRHVYIGSERIATVTEVNSNGMQEYDNDDLYKAGIRCINNSDYDSLLAVQSSMVAAYSDSLRVPYSGSPEAVRSTRSLGITGGLGVGHRNSSEDSGDNADNSRTAANDSVFYYHRDHLGSTMSVTDQSGNIVQQVEYTPWGEVFLEKRNGSYFYSPYLFNGKELDEETGLYYYGARYYDPRLSVWYSVDRFAEKYPFLSPYSYGKNNPINFIDINGDTLSWATNINSILVKIKVNKLRLKSTVFNTLYKKLDSHNTVYRIDANNQKVQESFRESSNWREDKAGAYTEGNKIIFSELNATDASFSEEFFHLYQNYLYGNRRTTYEKDAEAKLFNSVVLTEIDNSNYSITGINAIINTINNEFPQSFSYMSGHLITTLESITKTRMQVIKKTDGARLYYDFLKFFEEHHSQTDGDVYNGKQRFLLPNAYNTIIRELK